MKPNYGRELQDLSRLVYLVEHKASVFEFRDFILKENKASFKDGCDYIVKLLDTMEEKDARNFILFHLTEQEEKDGRIN